jgi:CDP-diacylglycerol--glycerol-3-phosphate 3-phosphatidyltransferase
MNGVNWAWVIFLLAAVFDFFDGWLARTFDQVTLVGKVFDPFVDRLLVFSGIISLYFSGRASLLPIVLIIGRDVIIIGGYILLHLKRVRMEVTYLGKIATFSIFFITLILLLDLGNENSLWLAVFLYLTSGVEYIYKGAHKLIQVYGRA